MRIRRGWPRTTLVLCLLAALLAVGRAAAQDTPPMPLTLDEESLGEISLLTLEAVYTFDNAQAQSVRVIVEARTPGFTPALRVLDTASAVIGELPNPGGLDRLEMILYLAEIGAYAFEVQSANGLGGQFAIRLVEASPPLLLTVGEEIAGTVTVDAPYDRYVFGAAETPLELVVGSIDSAEARVILVGDNGAEVLRASLELSPLRLTIPPGTRQYILSVEFRGAEGEAAYQVSLQGEAALAPPIGEGVPTGIPAAPGGPTPLPVLPIEGTPPSTLLCTAIPATTPIVNVRRGPGTNFDVIGQLGGNRVATVTGQVDDGTWYQIVVQPNGPSGWVSARAARLDGQCFDIPVVEVLADLVVIGIEADQDTGTTDVDFTVTIRNQGSAAARNFQVAVSFQPSDVETAILVFQEVGPGETESREFEADLISTGNYLVTATVDATNAVPESDETNNQGVEAFSVGG